MNTFEVLTAARELISVPERWTQGVHARNISGIAVATKGNLATCWCADGAINRVSGTDFVAECAAYERLDNVCFKLFGEGFIAYNDSHTHEEILALFDVAIAETKEELV